MALIKADLETFAYQSFHCGHLNLINLFDAIFSWHVLKPGTPEHPRTPEQPGVLRCSSVPGCSGILGCSSVPNFSTCLYSCFTLQLI